MQSILDIRQSILLFFDKKSMEQPSKVHFQCEGSPRNYGAPTPKYLSYQPSGVGSGQVPPIQLPTKSGLSSAGSAGPALLCDVLLKLLVAQVIDVRPNLDRGASSDWQLSPRTYATNASDLTSDSKLLAMQRVIQLFPRPYFDLLKVCRKSSISITVQNLRHARQQLRQIAELAVDEDEKWSSGASEDGSFRQMLVACRGMFEGQKELVNGKISEILGIGADPKEWFGLHAEDTSEHSKVEDILEVLIKLDAKHQECMEKLIKQRQLKLRIKEKCIT